MWILVNFILKKVFINGATSSAGLQLIVDLFSHRKESYILCYTYAINTDLV